MIKNLSISQKINALLILIFLFIIAGYALYQTEKNLWDELIFLGLLGLNVLTFLLFNNVFIKNIQDLTYQVFNIKQGNISLKIGKQNAPSLNLIAQTINFLTDNIEQATQIAKNIEQDNLAANSAIFNSDQTRQTDLSRALYNMQNQIQILAQAEKRRTWAIEGLAHFGELLRANNDNLRQLGDQLLGSLVPYVEAVQGGMFVVRLINKQSVSLDLVASFAYNRKKFIKKSILVQDNLAEGLLGQAYLEKGTIYLPDIPDDYLDVVSGLGDAPPKFILIIPLIHNEQVYGILELASFKEFATYQIEFVEKLAESIGAMINAIQVNEQTHKLLAESQEQSEALRAQEEEIRQNMEELAATQEEMKRKQIELEQQNERMKSTEAILQKALLQAKDAQKETEERNRELALAKSEMEKAKQALELQHEKIKANENILQKALLKSRETQKELQEKNQEFKKQEDLIRQYNEEINQQQNDYQSQLHQKDLEIEQLKEKLNNLNPSK